MNYLIGFGDWATSSIYTTPFIVGLVTLGMIFQFTPRQLGRELAINLRDLPSPVLGLLFGLGIFAIWSVAPEGVAPFIYFQF